MIETGHAFHDEIFMRDRIMARGGRPLKAVPPPRAMIGTRRASRIS